MGEGVIDTVRGLYCPKCKYVGLNCELSECPECDTSLFLIDVDKELLKEVTTETWSCWYCGKDRKLVACGITSFVWKKCGRKNYIMNIEVNEG